MAITVAGKQIALAALLPNGTNVYVALMTQLPNEDGTGGVEATGSSYARVAHSTWITSSPTRDITYRQNDDTVEFAALSGNLSNIVGWAIFDALTNGVCRAFGVLRNFSGDPTVYNFVTGNQPRFDTLTLQVGID